MKRRHLLAGACLVLLLVLVGGALGFLGYTRLVLGLTLNDQPVLLRLPEQLDARVRALNKVTVGLDGDVSARVPLRQSFAVPLRGTYEADVAFDADIPLRTVIHYQGMVPVDTVVALASDTGLVFNKRWLPKFPVRTNVPLRFNFPVNLTVPLDTRIRLAYRGPVRFSFNQTLTVPIDTVLRTRFHLDRDAEAPVQADFTLRTYLPQTPVAAVIRHADLRLRPESLSFQRSEQQ